MTIASGASAEPAACDPVVDAIRQQGPLSDLFLRAAASQLETTRGALRGPFPRQVALALVEAARRRILHEAAESPLAVLTQCGPRCVACCHTTTTDCTPLEALALAHYLRATRPAEEIDAIAIRLAEVAQRRGQLEPARRQTTRLRCGLLGQDGLCAAYAARPLICSGAMSFSREACYSAWSDPQRASAGAPLDHAMKVWTMGISGGLQWALAEAGYDANLYELNSILVRALEEPAALERWLRKEDVFAGCQCTDPHSPPRKMPLVPHTHGPVPGRPSRLTARRDVRPRHAT
jgi:Fe-S-cluster containining protein